LNKDVGRNYLAEEDKLGLDMQMVARVLGKNYPMARSLPELLDCLLAGGAEFRWIEHVPCSADSGHVWTAVQGEMFLNVAWKIWQFVVFAVYSRDHVLISAVSVQPRDTEWGRANQFIDVLRAAVSI